MGTVREFKSSRPNPFFELHGLSHTAFSCADMAKTIEFYTGKLGMELVMGQEVRSPQTGEAVFQHFFFDAGAGGLIGFMWRANGQPNLDPPPPSLMAGNIKDGLIHHFAMRVPEEKFAEYVDMLAERDITYEVVIHDNDGAMYDQIDRINGKTFAASVYFPDPDGIVLEFCAWLPGMDSLPRNLAGGTRIPVAVPA